MTSARDAGARRLRRCSVLLLAALALTLMAPPLTAAEVRVLHADPTRARVALPAGGTAGIGELELQLEADGRVHVLRLRPNLELGALRERLAGRAEAYEGKVGNYAGSWAAVTRRGDRWSGIWYDGGEYFGVDTAGALAGLADGAAALAADSLMVYRLRDVVWEDVDLRGDTREALMDGAGLATGLQPGAVLFAGNGATHRLTLAVVADALLAQQDGEAVEANLLTQLNVVDGLFANQLGVRIVADSVTIFTRRRDEPFGRTTDASDLLDEVASWRSATPAQHSAGITHLFTGRNLNGRTVGMAFLGTLCSRRYSTSLSQSTAAVSFAALIAAHEIAHVFGAPHDGEHDGACASTPTDYLMAPRINGSQEFSSCSVAQMTARAQTASCLVRIPVPAEWPPGGGPGSGGGGGGAMPPGTLALLAALAAALARRRLVHPA